MEREELGDWLEAMHDRYNREEFIACDPVSIPHAFTSQQDREISGFLTAAIAWGNRPSILRSARRMMSCMDCAPYDFTMNASEAELQGLLRFVHRTFNGEDLLAFVLALRRLYERYGTMGAFFARTYAASGQMRAVLSRLRSEFFAGPHPPRCEKHLSNVDRGAACKRLNMFVRWMVRRDDRGVDFGLWRDIPASALYLPLDLHTGRVGRMLGLLHRRRDDWRAVEEITAALRIYDPADPVRYDFALFGAGVEGAARL